MKRRGVSYMLVVALFLALMAATAFGQQADKGAGGNGLKQKPKYKIGGDVNKVKNLSAIKALMEESIEGGEVYAEDTIGELRGRFPLDKSKSVDEAALDFIDRHKEAFGLKNPKWELKLTRKDVDERGNIHLRYQQTYNGVPIWGEEFLAHVNKECEVYLMQPNEKTTPNLDTTPEITAEQAVEIAKNSMGLTAHAFRRSKSELIIYPYGIRSTLMLSYEIQMSVDRKSWQFMVDAKTGAILKKMDTTSID